VLSLVQPIVYPIQPIVYLSTGAIQPPGAVCRRSGPPGCPRWTPSSA